MPYRTFRPGMATIIEEPDHPKFQGASNEESGPPTPRMQYIFAPTDIPAICLPGPMTPLPDTIENFGSSVGDLLAALWHVQEYMPGGRWEKKSDLIDEMVFSSFTVLTFRVARAHSPFADQLRVVHKPNIPMFEGHAVPSYNEHAITLCEDRSSYLCQWGKSDWKLSDLPNVPKWVDQWDVADLPANMEIMRKRVYAGLRIIANLENIRKSWPFERVNAADLAQHAEIEASWIKATIVPDGPIGTDGFRWMKIEHRGLRNQAFRLVNYLWKQPSRTAEFIDLAVPVFDDHAVDPTDDQVASARRDANKFFNSNEIPFSVHIQGRRVELTAKDERKV